uniref:Uncharacterized protein n=1 Tax=Neospora caninum (strain Liverpool) TaxID=572307 RepID=A0A0F7UCY0_NEOCL|nr:TPA: hypothetical protein BN1204_020810 [Neospora caninum Liverpool]
MSRSDGRDPGINVVQPVDASRLSCNTTVPASQHFAHCGYCTLIHRDSTTQGMYPLTPAQLQGSEYHRESPDAFAGLPSTLWNRDLGGEATPSKRC